METRVNGSAVGLVRLGNVLSSQVHNKDISEGENIYSTFLLELITPKIRDQIGNLKPGAVGYNTAWQRLKREYRETKHVIICHKSQVITVKSSHQET